MHTQELTLHVVPLLMHTQVLTLLNEQFILLLRALRHYEQRLFMHTLLRALHILRLLMHTHQRILLNDFERKKNR